MSLRGEAPHEPQVGGSEGEGEAPPAEMRVGAGPGGKRRFRRDAVQKGLIQKCRLEKGRIHEGLIQKGPIQKAFIQKEFHHSFKPIFGSPSNLFGKLP